MVFIRKKIQEEVDWTDSSPEEVVDAGIKAIATSDGAASAETATTEEVVTEEEVSQERVYDWHDILEVLSDYIHPDIVRQIEDDWMFNYPDNFMDQASVDDLINDINSQYNEELASEIKARIDQLQSSKNDNPQDLNNYYSNFEKSFNEVTNTYNNGLLSKLEYLGQAGKLIHDFINGLQSFDETQRGELFTKAEELVNNNL